MMTIVVISLWDKNKAEVWIKHLNNPFKQGNSFQTRKQYQSNYSDLSALTNDQLQQTIKSANHNTSQFRAAISLENMREQCEQLALASDWVRTWCYSFSSNYT